MWWNYTQPVHLTWFVPKVGTLDPLIHGRGTAGDRGVIPSAHRSQSRCATMRLRSRFEAMAQPGDPGRARVLLRSAARAFGPKEAVARPRCVVAKTGTALVWRDLGWPAKALDAARATLEEHGGAGW